MWWVLGIGLVVGLGALAWFGSRPLVHRAVPLEQLDRFAWSLAVQMTPGSVMVADRNEGPGFLQFAVITGRRQWAELEFGLPEVDWSVGRIGQVQDALAAAGIAAAYDPAGSPDEIRFLRARVSGPHEKVRKICGAVMVAAAGALGWGSPTFDVRLLGALRRANERGA